MENGVSKFTSGVVAGWLSLWAIAVVFNHGEKNACASSGFKSEYCQCMLTVGLLEKDQTQ